MTGAYEYTITITSSNKILGEEKQHLSWVWETKEPVLPSSTKNVTCKSQWTCFICMDWNVEYFIFQIQYLYIMENKVAVKY